MVSMLLFVDVYNFFHVANVLLFCVFILLYLHTGLYIKVNRLCGIMCVLLGLFM